ncbi:uncharacterized protein [Rutidosis leptorrhynchoides]|uniref:uncharacterized protein n=1 Tax=Rutidosis leptorrhynchoides TaxID=125765 RepID=UPI003A996DD8
MEEPDERFSGLKIGANQESLEVSAKLAIRCLDSTQDKRPTMKVVIEELQKALKLQEKRRDIIKFSLADINLGTEDNCFTEGEGLVKLYQGEVQYGNGYKSVILKVDRSCEEHNFRKEIEILVGLEHENIVQVLGYWVANGIKFLHESSRQLIVHRDIKSANIVLNGDWDAKIYGFEFSLKSPNEEIEYVINDVIGSLGYCDPVYKETRFLTKESDIYSFGVVLFEMLCGRLTCPNDLEESNEFLDSLVKRHSRVGRLEEIVFEDIKGQIALDSLATFQMIANQCLHEERKKRPTADEVALQLKKALELQETINTGVLHDIKLATENFDVKYILGEGGFGKVYKAELGLFGQNLFLGIEAKNPDEMCMKRNTVAIKRINEKEKGEKGFFLEIEILRRCKHPNIVSLLGYCNEDSEMILVYEFVPNGSLDDYLENIENKTYLNWVQRIKICLDIAHGLNYLHTSTNIKDKERIIHRDIKSGNILLDKNWKAKIADFGLSKFYNVNQVRSTIKTNSIAGSDYYMDPEYSRTGKLKKESDIYSLGVVFFEILCGRLACDRIYLVENIKGLAPVARKCYKERTLKKLIDPNLMEEADELLFGLKVGVNQESLEVFADIAFKCLAKTHDKRPTMEVIIEELQKALNLQEKRNDIIKFSLDDIKLGTEDFSDQNFIAKDGSGKLYRGEVPYGNGLKPVVLKVNGSSEEQKFVKELEVLFGLKHENVIEVVGYCKEMDENIIVYENVSNWSTLNGYVNDARVTWTKRLEICIGVANGLKFLHEGFERQQSIVHRDIKSANIVLNGDWNAKIYGFELSLISPKNQELKYVVNDVVGSPGYCDPMCRETGFLTKESDIYSFGVVLFEILCGRLACLNDLGESNEFVDSFVKRHKKDGRIDEIVLEGIKKQIAPNSIATFEKIAYQCLHKRREKRPTANEVVVQLKEALKSQVIWDESLKDRSSISINSDLYFLRLEEGDDLSNHLDSFNRLVCELSKTGEIIKQEELGLRLLVSLPPSYNQFVQNIRREGNTALKDVVHKLRDYK